MSQILGSPELEATAAECYLVTIEDETRKQAASPSLCCCFLLSKNREGGKTKRSVYGIDNVYSK